MGREVRCGCMWNTGSGTVTALLEATEIIVRGDLKRRLPIAGLDVKVTGDALRLTVAGETITLDTGATEAARWAAKIALPPPSLRDKLGIKAETGVLVVGTTLPDEIAVAVANNIRVLAGDAAMTVAVVDGESALRHAVERHAGLPPRAPIWIIHGKGPKAAYGERAVREAMRAVGFVDTKVAAVSVDLTATRFSSRDWTTPGA
jgi:hypothetical protein